MITRVFFCSVAGWDGSITWFDSDISIRLSKQIFRLMKLKLKYAFDMIKHYIPSMNRRQQKKVVEIGTIFIHDISMPVSQRVKKLRTFMRDVRIEAEKIKMTQFKQLNGFAADDDNAKRALIDQVVYERLKQYPKDDDERNEYISSPMMQIGWRPSA
jgi:hypothetical protein